MSLHMQIKYTSYRHRCKSRPCKFKCIKSHVKLHANQKYIKSKGTKEKKTSYLSGHACCMHVKSRKKIFMYKTFLIHHTLQNK